MELEFHPPRVAVANRAGSTAGWWAETGLGGQCRTQSGVCRTDVGGAVAAVTLTELVSDCPDITPLKYDSP